MHQAKQQMQATEVRPQLNSLRRTRGGSLRRRRSNGDSPGRHRPSRPESGSLADSAGSDTPGGRQSRRSSTSEYPSALWASDLPWNGRSSRQPPLSARQSRTRWISKIVAASRREERSTRCAFRFGIGPRRPLAPDDRLTRDSGAAIVRPGAGCGWHAREGVGLRRSLPTGLRGWLRDLALIVLALGMGSASVVSGILCIGGDGHVAVERSQGGRCVGGEPMTAASAPFEAPGLSPAGPDSHCGPCTDLVGAPGEWLANAKLAQDGPGPAFAAAATLGGAPWTQSPPMLRAPAARDLPGVPFLRGAVLRC